MIRLLGAVIYANQSDTELNSTGHDQIRLTCFLCKRAILRYSFCRGRDILDIHPSITLSILLVEHSCCTYMEAVTYVFQCVINICL